MSEEEKQIEELAERTRSLLLAFIKWAGSLLELGLLFSSRIEENRTLKKFRKILRDVKKDVDFLLGETGYTQLPDDFINELIEKLEREMLKRNLKGERKRGYMEALNVLKQQRKSKKKIKKVRINP